MSRNLFVACSLPLVLLLIACFSLLLTAPVVASSTTHTANCVPSGKVHLSYTFVSGPIIILQPSACTEITIGPTVVAHSVNFTDSVIDSTTLKIKIFDTVFTSPYAAINFPGSVLAMQSFNATNVLLRQENSASFAAPRSLVFHAGNLTNVGNYTIANCSMFMNFSGDTSTTTTTIPSAVALFSTSTNSYVTNVTNFFFLGNTVGVEVSPATLQRHHATTASTSSSSSSSLQVDIVFFGAHFPEQSAEMGEHTALNMFRNVEGSSNAVSVTITGHQPHEEGTGGAAAAAASGVIISGLYIASSASVADGIVKWIGNSIDFVQHEGTRAAVGAVLASHLRFGAVRHKHFLYGHGSEAYLQARGNSITARGVSASSAGSIIIGTFIARAAVNGFSKLLFYLNRVEVSHASAEGKFHIFQAMFRGMSSTAFPSRTSVADIKSLSLVRCAVVVEHSSLNATLPSYTQVISLLWIRGLAANVGSLQFAENTFDVSNVEQRGGALMFFGVYFEFFRSMPVNNVDWISVRENVMNLRDVVGRDGKAFLSAMWFVAVPTLELPLTSGSKALMFVQNKIDAANLTSASTIRLIVASMTGVLPLSASGTANAYSFLQFNENEVRASQLHCTGSGRVSVIGILVSSRMSVVLSMLIKENALAVSDVTAEQEQGSVTVGVVSISTIECQVVHFQQNTLAATRVSIIVTSTVVSAAGNPAAIRLFGIGLFAKRSESSALPVLQVSLRLDASFNTLNVSSLESPGPINMTMTSFSLHVVVTPPTSSADDGPMHTVRITSFHNLHHISGISSSSSVFVVQNLIAGRPATPAADDDKNVSSLVKITVKSNTMEADSITSTFQNKDDELRSLTVALVFLGDSDRDENEVEGKDAPVRRLWTNINVAMNHVSGSVGSATGDGGGTHVSVYPALYCGGGWTFGLDPAVVAQTGADVGIEITNNSAAPLSIQTSAETVIVSLAVFEQAVKHASGGGGGQLLFQGNHLAVRNSTFQIQRPRVNMFWFLHPVNNITALRFDNNVIAVTDVEASHKGIYVTQLNFDKSVSNIQDFSVSRCVLNVSRGYFASGSLLLHQVVFVSTVANISRNFLFSSNVVNISDVFAGRIIRLFRFYFYEALTNVSKQLFVISGNTLLCERWAAAGGTLPSPTGFDARFIDIRFSSTVDCGDRNVIKAKMFVANNSMRLENDLVNAGRMTVTHFRIATVVGERWPSIEVKGCEMHFAVVRRRAQSHYYYDYSHQHTLPPPPHPLLNGLAMSLVSFDTALLIKIEHSTLILAERDLGGAPSADSGGSAGGGSVDDGDNSNNVPAASIVVNGTVQVAIFQFRGPQATPVYYSRYVTENSVIVAVSRRSYTLAQPEKSFASVVRLIQLPWSQLREHQLWLQQHSQFVTAEPAFRGSFDVNANLVARNMSSLLLLKEKRASKLMQTSFSDPLVTELDISNNVAALDWISFSLIIFTTFNASAATAVHGAFTLNKNYLPGSSVGGVGNGITQVFMPLLLVLASKHSTTSSSSPSSSGALYAPELVDLSRSMWFLYCNLWPATVDRHFLRRWKPKVSVLPYICSEKRVEFTFTPLRSESRNDSLSISRTVRDRNDATLTATQRDSKSHTLHHVQQQSPSRSKTSSRSPERVNHADEETLTTETLALSRQPDAIDDNTKTTSRSPRVLREHTTEHQQPRSKNRTAAQSPTTTTTTVRNEKPPPLFVRAAAPSALVQSTRGMRSATSAAALLSRSSMTALSFQRVASLSRIAAACSQQQQSPSSAQQQGNDGNATTTEDNNNNNNNNDNNQQQEDTTDTGLSILSSPTQLSIGDNAAVAAMKGAVVGNVAICYGAAVVLAIAAAIYKCAMGQDEIPTWSAAVTQFCLPGRIFLPFIFLLSGTSEAVVGILVMPGGGGFSASNVVFAAVGAVFVLLVTVWWCVAFLRNMRQNDDEEEEDYAGGRRTSGDGRDNGREAAVNFRQCERTLTLNPPGWRLFYYKYFEGTLMWYETELADRYFSLTDAVQRPNVIALDLFCCLICGLCSGSVVPGSQNCAAQSIIVLIALAVHSLALLIWWPAYFSPWDRVSSFLVSLLATAIGVATMLLVSGATPVQNTLSVIEILSGIQAAFGAVMAVVMIVGAIVDVYDLAVEKCHRGVLDRRLQRAAPSSSSTSGGGRRGKRSRRAHRYEDDDGGQQEEEYYPSVFIGGRPDGRGLSQVTFHEDIIERVEEYERELVEDDGDDPDFEYGSERRPPSFVTNSQAIDNILRRMNPSLSSPSGGGGGASQLGEFEEVLLGTSATTPPRRGESSSPGSRRRFFFSPGNDDDDDDDGMSPPSSPRERSALDSIQKISLNDV